MLAALFKSTPSLCRITPPCRNLPAALAVDSRPFSTEPESKLEPKPFLSPVAEQLARVAELQRRAASISSKTEKASLIAEYPDLRDLLEHVYQPKLLLHVSALTLGKYLENPEKSVPKLSSEDVPASITDLFDLLSARTVTGNAAKDLVVSFLAHHGILLPAGGSNGDRRELYETFERLLDRNLVAGFGARTLLTVPWAAPAPSLFPGSPSTAYSIRQDPDQLQAVSTPPHTPLASTSSRAVETRGRLQKFSCALGTTIEPPFDKLFSGKAPSRWYVSRKLDGVRCLTFIDIAVPPDEAVPLKIHRVEFVSRQGNTFTSLARLAEQVKEIIKLPELRDWLARDPCVIDHENDDNGDPVKRLVLDGEVCVMRALTEAERASRIVLLSDQGYGTHVPVGEGPSDNSAAGQLWNDDGFVEDFPSTVSQIRRRNENVAHPAYFLLDVLPWIEVDRKLGQVGKSGLGRPFGDRISDCQRVATFLASELDRRGGDVTEKLVRAVDQCPVQSRSDIDAMVERAANEGWEGLVMRADKPYKGKRSTDLFKFKQWKDDEYTVKGMDTSKMRLAVNGVFGEHVACSNVWISHKGHPVSVGSGFSAEQRLRYARDPTQIIGKMITVEYFGESEASDRDKSTLSLRFPRIKQVWDDGPRTI